MNHLLEPEVVGSIPDTTVKQDNSATSVVRSNEYQCRKVNAIQAILEILSDTFSKLRNLFWKFSLRLCNFSDKKFGINNKTWKESQGIDIQFQCTTGKGAKSAAKPEKIKYVRKSFGVHQPTQLYL